MTPGAESNSELGGVRVLVTGATSGLGAEMATTLTRAGARVIAGTVAAGGSLRVRIDAVGDQRECRECTSSLRNSSHFEPVAENHDRDE